MAKRKPRKLANDRLTRISRSLRDIKCELRGLQLQVKDEYPKVTALIMAGDSTITVFEDCCLQPLVEIF